VVIPLLVLAFLLAGTVLAASVAGSPALVAHRRLAADCDGAALAGAAEVDRSTAPPSPAPPRSTGARPETPTAQGFCRSTPLRRRGPPRPTSGRSRPAPGPGRRSPPAR
jgi:hypothetical protein